MKFATAGERLFYFIREELLDALGEGETNWSSASRVIEYSTGHQDASTYIRGASSVFAMRNLLRYWHEEKKTTDSGQAQKIVESYAKAYVFPIIDAPNRAKLARLVIAADLSSNRPISTTTRNAVLGGKQQHSCYLCGKAINSQASAGNPAHLSLEHLWPTSIGGDSIEENLLPACDDCQETTKDTVSWEWLNVHNLVLPPSPSAGALSSVIKAQRYSVHYRSVVELCSLYRLSLKEGFLRLGPMKATNATKRNTRSTTFFELITSE